MRTPNSGFLNEPCQKLLPWCGKNTDQREHSTQPEFIPHRNINRRRFVWALRIHIRSGCHHQLIANSYRKCLQSGPPRLLLKEYGVVGRLLREGKGAVPASSRPRRPRQPPFAMRAQNPWTSLVLLSWWQKHAVPS